MSYDSSTKENGKVSKHDCKHTALAWRGATAADPV
ncbi:Uncharacterised protein [Corynebacterium minutissimum]|uniref:Uncharacterized protein n=1 Tax=Corynebacterium minutissimum TaxID=38301 RepID=A0A2X4RFJ0_9CORY|nr:Uncharacterised protein [Corynebacterium minutissimum]VEG05329.1 Uncharacterised protein [Corynebacterium minutissimum]